jgi:hypothetical protein
MTSPFGLAGLCAFQRCFDIVRFGFRFKKQNGERSIAS